MTTTPTFEEHYARFADPQRDALVASVAVVRAALPGAGEVFSYGLPTFKLDGGNGPAVVAIEGFKNHNSIFPFSTAVLTRLADELAQYPQTKGGIHVDRDKPVPRPLLKRMLAIRIGEVNAASPSSKGEVRRYYDNGFLKESGRMRGDLMTGAWRWFRRDGTILRSGSFRDGEQTGDWVTYDRTGQPHKVTRF